MVEMNMSDVVRQVTRLIGDENETQIFNTDIMDWANEYIMVLARESEFNQLLDQSTYGPSTTGRTVPLQFIGEKRVTFNDVPLNRTTLLELDKLGAETSSGNPTHFYFWGSVMFLWPTPSTSGTLKIWYTAAVNAIGDMDSELPCPLIYHKDVVRACIMRAREQSEDFEQAAALAAEVTQLTGKVSYDQAFQSREGYPVVRGDPADA
jgi:hypothetical protein